MCYLFQVDSISVVWGLFRHLFYLSSVTIAYCALGSAEKPARNILQNCLDLIYRIYLFTKIWRKDNKILRIDNNFLLESIPISYIFLLFDCFFDCWV